MQKIKMKIEKEKELFALMMNDPNSSVELFSKITPDMISEVNREIFKAVTKLKPVDQQGILWELKRNNSPFVSEILDLQISVTNVGNRIKEFFDIHYSIMTDKLLAEAIKSNRDNLKGLDVLSTVQSNLKSELDKLQRFEKPISFYDSFDSILERIEKRMEKNDSIQIVSYPAFNIATRGLNEGNLVGIAGAFKNGKTTFGLNLILDIATQGIPSAIFSLEMTKNEVSEKILAHKSNVSYEKLRDPQRLSNGERTTIQRLKKNPKEQKEKLFIFDDKPTIDELKTRITDLSRREGVKTILIDYLNLIETGYRIKNNEPREREIALISRSLKSIAKETGTVIFILSQLNRSGINEATSANLADSLALARDCDFLFTIYKPAEENKILKYGNKSVENNGNLFVVKLDSSRHTQSGKSFIIELSHSGKMNELKTSVEDHGKLVTDFSKN